MTTTNFERLKEIRKQVNNIREIVERFSYPTEYTRLEYLFSELDTLMVISKVIKNKSYKESFILLRSSFEKFLFFWLMFEGKIYRFSQIVKIHPKTNSTPQQARDKTFLLYKSEKEKGNPLFKDVSIDKRVVLS